MAPFQCHRVTCVKNRGGVCVRLLRILKQASRFFQTWQVNPFGLLAPDGRDTDLPFFSRFVYEDLDCVIVIRELVFGPLSPNLCEKTRRLMCFSMSWQRSGSTQLFGE